MPAPRRRDARHCSGKAKRHATKTRYATAHGGLILQYIDSRRWGKHGFAVFKGSVPTFSGNLPRRQETALDRQRLKFIKYSADSATLEWARWHPNIPTCLENERLERK